MKNTSKILMVVMTVLAFSFAQAQETSPVDFMRMNPYQMKANPATELPYESVMSLVVGNVGFDMQNTTLRFDNLYDFDAQGRPTAYNLRKFANSLKENNFLGSNANLDIFTLFKRQKYGMLTINYGIKAQGDAKYGDGLFKLLGYGNSAFVGNDHPATINLNMNAIFCQELAVGYQMNITDQLSIGWRAKLLFGIVNMRTDAFDARLYTDADSYALRLEENIAVRAGLPTTIYFDDYGQLKTNGLFKAGELFRNPGFGIDLAAEYRFNDRFSAVAAVNDLGFIHWGLNNIGMKGQIHDAGQFYDNGDFLFEGLDVDQMQLIFSDDNYRDQFLDTLQQYFKLEFSPMEAYNTSLNTNILLRGNYDLDPHNRFSLQAQGRFYHSGFRPALTFAYNGYFYDKLDVCVTYTMMPHSYDNIGLGIGGRMFKTCQVYLTTDVIGLFNPLNTSGMNVQLGIVFVLRPEDNDHIYE